MPPKPPPPRPRTGDDGTYSELSPNTPEQVIGAPRVKMFGVRVPPKVPAPAPPPVPSLLPPPEQDTMPPAAPVAQAPLHGHHGRSGATLVGPAGPPARGAAPEPVPSLVPPVAERVRLPPPKSITPVPVSVTSENVLVSDKGLRLKLTWSQVRSWLLVFGIFGGGGFVTGAYAGFRSMVAVIAGITETEREHARLLGKQGAAIEGLATRLETDENSQKAEKDSNRAERATALQRLEGFAGDLELVKKSLPSIQGLAPPKKK